MNSENQERIFLKNIKIETIEDLRATLQTAIELEHATIPPYLTANFTLNATGNDEIVALVGSIVGEEMLHLSIACNVLNSIDGRPDLNNPEFIPTYPHTLPGSVESSLEVPLKKFSKELVEDVFMVIEKPEKPIDIKVNMLNLEAKQSLTIGEFYTLIIHKMELLEMEARGRGKTIFTGDPKKQMTSEKWMPAKLLFPITDLETARRGINLIIDQGEGTSTDPFVNNEDETGTEPEPAHYYRFQEIVKGKRLIKNPNPPGGYSYAGPAIPFDGTKIPNMWPNPRMCEYPEDSVAFFNSKLFNYTYSSLLNCLHMTFNGQPEKINTAMGLMYSVRLYAFKLLQSPDPKHPGYVAGPSFEYITSDDMTNDELDAMKSRH